MRHHIENWGRAFILGIFSAGWFFCQFAPENLACLLAEDAAPSSLDDDPASVEFFENRIRPVLVEHCYECHNSHDKREGGLALDFGPGLLEGGTGGPAIDLTQPNSSRLLLSIRHELEGYEMPTGRAKLPDRVLADFERWIVSGAADPRREPPTAQQHAALTEWPEVRQRRLAWWAYQPIQTPPLPSGSGFQNPIDVFIHDKLQSAQLTPAPKAKSAVLVRRLFMVLIGLPPTSEQARYWTQQLDHADVEQQQIAYERLVDELLASPHYGERWARHWMDWIRYAESHGSEGDPTIVNAYQYRDYLIRSLNQDISYDQLVREHVAGDLLEQPRLNPELGLNESRLATAHWRMVFHGFSPTDALDEQVRFLDDQINVFSKAFLGLTISCARCHDHKFDPIGQDDYYALYGIFRSNRPARHVVNQVSGLPTQIERLSELKPRIRAALAQDWLADSDGLRARVARFAESAASTNDPKLGLSLLWRASQAEKQGQSVEELWQADRQAWQEFAIAAAAEAASGLELTPWYANSGELPTTRQPAGEFAVASEDDRAVVGIYPAGIFSHGLSAKLAARLTSKNVAISEPQELWVQVIGDRDASLRYVVRDYPRDGTIYPIERLNGQTWQWRRFDLSYWIGDLVHLELTHAQDAPLLVAAQERSWFGIRTARLTPAGAPAPRTIDESIGAVMDRAGEQAPQSLEDVATLYHQAIRQAITDWTDQRLTDSQALLLDAALKQNLLANQLESLPTARPLIQEFQTQERAIETPLRVPGLVEAEVADQAIFVRGDHRRPSESVPRRFLSMIDETPYAPTGSGRRPLAEDLVREDNPLTRRVIVNRLWHHLFGRGLVATPDNFGKLGSEPTHPELLDWLADRFSTELQWSLKKMIRQIVMSETWQRDSAMGADVAERDPGQLLLAGFPIRRLEAETMRDNLLLAAGRLERTPFGPSLSDPLHPRRAIYSAVRRNSLDPFLRVFDFPEPSTTVGRRDVTTVPAQSLTMLNSPLAQQASERLAETLLADSQLADDRQRVTELYWRCFSRAPEDREVEQALAYLDEIRLSQEETRTRWQQLQTKKQAANDELNAILEPVRKRLSGASAAPTLPVLETAAPVARWSFANSVHDQVGQAAGSLEGSAAIQDGALVLDGNGYLISQPLSQPLAAKTLEAWVQLSNLTQQGGGVISVQSADGHSFDSIVFGEQEAGRWMAGSNSFQRTQSLGGDFENEALTAMIQVVMVYQEDGLIRAYRNGQPYGRPYQTNGPLRFGANEAVVTLGLRHLPAEGQRFLHGQVFEARLYDHALSETQVAANYQQGLGLITWSQLLSELSPAEQARVATRQAESQEFERQAQALLPQPAALDANAVWSELIQALFLSVEFTTIR